jgi:hypothetical protein
VITEISEGVTAMANRTSAEPTQPIETKGELPYLIIQEADSNSVLNPINAADGATAKIAFDGMERSLLKVYWALKGQEAPTFEPLEWLGSASGSVVVPLPWHWVSTSAGHTVQIFYTAVVGGQLKCSLVLELEVQQIREEYFAESLPVFTDATGDPNDRTLDMYSFSGDAWIEVKAWPLIQEGHRLFLNVAGDQHKPEFQYSWVAQDYIVSAEEAHAGHVFRFRLPRGWLARREDYSALTVHFGIIFDGTDPQPPKPVPDPIYGSHLPGNALEVSPRTTVRLRVDPSIEPIIETDDFNSYLTQEFMKTGSSIHTRLLRLELPLNSYHGIGLHGVRGAGEVVPGMVDGQSLALRCGYSGDSQRQHVFMHLKWKCKRVRFAYSSVNNSSLVVDFFDENDKRLGDAIVLPPGWVDFEAEEGDYITKISLITSYHGSVDSLTIWHEEGRTQEPL